MGGGDQGSKAAAMSSQELLDEFKKQQTYDRINKPFQQLAAGIGTQLPYIQAPGAQPTAGPGIGAAAGPTQAGPSPLAATGPLFPGQGMGAGGIDPQQLAAILQRLGYGG